MAMLQQEQEGRQWDPQRHDEIENMCDGKQIAVRPDDDAHDRNNRDQRTRANRTTACGPVASTVSYSGCGHTSRESRKRTEQKRHDVEHIPHDTRR